MTEPNSEIEKNKMLIRNEIKEEEENSSGGTTIGEGSVASVEIGGGITEEHAYSLEDKKPEIYGNIEDSGIEQLNETIENGTNYNEIDQGRRKELNNHLGTGKQDKRQGKDLNSQKKKKKGNECKFVVANEETVEWQIPTEYDELGNIEDLAESLRQIYPNDLWAWRGDLCPNSGEYPKPFDSREFLNRPARQQVDPTEVIKYAYTQGDDEFNIWYGRYATDRGERRYRVIEPSSTRLHYELDVGYTAAKDPATPICLYFAKGCCAFGAKCIYRHQLPTTQDEVLLDASHDVFGRPRCATHRDDMDGIGSFFEPCDTLFVSNLNFSGLQAELEVIKSARINATADPLTIHGISSHIVSVLDKFDMLTPQSFQDAAAYMAEHIIVHEFSPFGAIVEVRVIYRKQIAFLRYASRVFAEFAKVALNGQKLPLITECMAVRWAHARGLNRIKEEEKPYQNIEPKTYSKDGPHANFFRGLTPGSSATKPSPLQQVQNTLVQELYNSIQYDETKVQQEQERIANEKEYQFHLLLQKIDAQNSAFDGGMD